MKDLITYIEDLESFRVEIVEIEKNPDHPANLLVKLDENGGFIFNDGLHIPVYYNGNKSLCLCRTDKVALIEDHVTNMEVIGECVGNEYKFRAYGKDKYERAYDRTPVETEDSSGNKLSITPPYMIGVFA